MEPMKKVFSVLIIALLLINTIFVNISYAYEDKTPQLPPSKLRLNDGESMPIGHNEYDGYYVSVKWDVEFPYDAVNGYVNLYTMEIDQTFKPRIAYATEIPENRNTHKIQQLKSGTVYYIDVTAYHTHDLGNGNLFSSPESQPSNRLKVLTDIEIAAYSYDTDKIKIEWDDVWNTGGRIGYRLYVSENKNFANTPPIYISPSEIGGDGPVKINESTGKLEYIHTVRDSARVYYVKIAPDISDQDLKRNPESDVVAASSYILVKTTKMSVTDAGVVWRLDWSPVVTGLDNSNIEIYYEIYRGTTASGDIPQYVAKVDDTSFYVTLPEKEQNNYYYIIRAVVTRNGSDLYEGIRIQSDRIFVKEEDVPATPAMPELVNEFRNRSGDVIISYDEELEENSATILWRVPKKGNGTVDVDIEYDIWLITDPDMIEDPLPGQMIEKSFKPGVNNRVMDENNLIGYKYTITGLTPNTTYYFKITANKKCIDYVDGELTQITKTSDPALKIIITPGSSGVEQPLVPERPPLTVKTLPDGSLAVNDTTATIQIKNRWYEKFENGKWTYVKTEKSSENDTVEYDPVKNPPDNVNYREVKYDSGVTIDVGCVEYEKDMSYEEVVNSEEYYVIKGFPTTANDPYEDPKLNPPDKLDPLVYSKHNVDILLTGLKPNTTYVIWVRASRADAGLVSGPSDPIIITTESQFVVPVERPTVPIIKYGVAGDTYVDLSWDMNIRYNYYIKYSTKDDINTAQKTILVTPEDMLFSTYYRIDSLNPDTVYYFWIQAEARNADGVTSKSEWSDSYPIKTLPYIPPDVPKGFGIKNYNGAVGKNSIHYEWIMEEGLEYILEIADNADYKNSQEINVGSVSDYKVEGLRSNCRYYARLYAYDPKKDLRSYPTHSVSVKTKKSTDDYDADKDTDDVISGDFIQKDEITSDFVWKISITGVNASRFVEYVSKDGKIDYEIDLSTPPSRVDKIILLISNTVFEGFNTLGENLVITTERQKLVIRPYTMSIRQQNALMNKYGDFNYEITIDYNGSLKSEYPKNFKLKTAITGITVKAYDGSTPISVNVFNKPLKVLYPYVQEGWYSHGVTVPIIYPSGQKSWQRFEASSIYDNKEDKNYVCFETVNTGYMAIADVTSVHFDDIIGHKYESSINNIMSVHPLKSVSGRFFEPDKDITLGEAVKLAFDIMDYHEYGSEYMASAAKIGLISYSDAAAEDELCTREKAIAMAAALYGKKTGSKLSYTGFASSIYVDLNQVRPDLLPKVMFAVENGLCVSTGSNYLSPGDYITRGEMAAILEKVLALSGELE